MENLIGLFFATMWQMSTNEAVCYDEDPHYQAFMAEGPSPWFEGLSPSPPDPAIRHLSVAERHTHVVEGLSMIDRSVRRLVSQGVPLDLDDARQDGAEGLCDAAQRFDRFRGARFETYAPSRVRGQIIDNLRSYDGLAGSDRKEARVVSQLNSTRARSIFEPLYGLAHGDKITLLDTIAADGPSVETHVERKIEKDFVDEAIDQLGERQRQVITGWMRHMSRETIANMLGVSLSTVGRDLRKARQTLRLILEPQLFD